MINYALLWQTMKEKEITTYLLLTKYQINPRTIKNLTHNRGIRCYTMKRLTELLNCTPIDVVVLCRGDLGEDAAVHILLELYII